MISRPLAEIGKANKQSGSTITASIYALMNARAIGLFVAAGALCGALVLKCQWRHHPELARIAAVSLLVRLPTMLSANIPSAIEQPVPLPERRAQTGSRSLPLPGPHRANRPLARRSRSPTSSSKHSSTSSGLRHPKYGAECPLANDCVHRLALRWESALSHTFAMPCCGLDAPLCALTNSRFPEPTCVRFDAVDCRREKLAEIGVLHPRKGEGLEQLACIHCRHRRLASGGRDSPARRNCR